MFSCTHTHTRTYKLRCLSTRCIKKWNLFFWQTISIWNMTALSPLPLCRSSCAIRACRMPHLQFIFKIYHTAHTANAAYVRSMYTPRRPSVCVCVHMTRASTTWPPASCSLFHLHTVLISISNIYFPLYLASSASSARRHRRYCRLQITVNNRTERNICPPLCRTTS